MADNKELIDEEWLASVGFYRTSIGMMRYGPLSADVHSVKTFNVPLDWYVGKSHGEMLIRPPACRQEVRDLMRLLVEEDGNE